MKLSWKKQAPTTAQTTIILHTRAKFLMIDTRQLQNWDGGVVLLSGWQKTCGGTPLADLVTPYFSARLSFSRSKEEPESPRYVAIKIGTCTYSSIAASEHELKLSQRIASTNPSHPGAGYIRTLIDNFQIDRSYGIHICLVYRPMRETLHSFQRRFKNKQFPPQLLKLYIVLLLQGLNYLHSECHLIHTGKSTTLINRL
jgi:serine/threonine protein kinase